MPKYRYYGEAPVNYGSQVVNTGDVVEASASPGKRFELVVEPAASPSAPAPAADEPASEELSRGRKSTNKGGE